MTNKAWLNIFYEEGTREEIFEWLKIMVKENKELREENQQMVEQMAGEDL